MNFPYVLGILISSSPGGFTCRSPEATRLRSPPAAAPAKKPPRSGTRGASVRPTFPTWDPRSRPGRLLRWRNHDLQPCAVALCRAPSTLPAESGHGALAGGERPSSAPGAAVLPPAPANEGPAEPPPLLPPGPAESPGMGGAGRAPQPSPELHPHFARTPDPGGEGPAPDPRLAPGPHPGLAESRKRAAGAAGPSLGQRGARSGRRGCTRGEGALHPTARGPAGGAARGGGGRGARAGAAVLAAVSAPGPGAQHVTEGPEAAPGTPAPPQGGRCPGARAHFPAARGGACGARGRARSPCPPAAAAGPATRLTSGPRVAAARLLVRHGRAAPARERNLRRSPRAPAGPRPRPRRRSGRV